MLVSGQKALELGLNVIAKITGYADAAQVLKESKSSGSLIGTFAMVSYVRALKQDSSEGF